MKEYTIGSNDAGQKVDKFILKVAKQLPKSMLYKMIRKKRIKRNGKRCDAADQLVEGDLLQLYINDEFFGEQRNPSILILCGGNLILFMKTRIFCWSTSLLGFGYMETKGKPKILWYTKYNNI